MKPRWKHFDGKGSGVRTWDTGLQNAQDGSKEAERYSSRPRAEEEAKRPTMPDEKPWKQGHWWAKKEEKESMPQPAEGIWSSQGGSFAPPIKGFLLPALPRCGFPRQKWLCYWVSTGAWKQLWVCGLPGCSLSPLNASLGPLGPKPFISRVSSDSHWVYSVICFVNCRSQGIIPSWSFTLQSLFFVLSKM